MGNRWLTALAGLVGLLAWEFGCAMADPDPARRAVHFDGGLPPYIHQVESFGLWQDGSATGRQRIVVTRHCTPAHCAHRTYVQWLVDASDSEGRQLRAAEVATALLVELGTHGLVERISPAPSVEHPARFEIESAHALSGAVQIDCVTPGRPGEYEIRGGRC